MANIFYRKVSRNVSTTLTKVGNYTTSTTTIVVGLTITNTTGAAVAVDVTLNDGTNDYYIIKTAPIGSGSALVVVGGDQKLVLQSGDSIKVKSDAATSVDIVMSVMEIS